MATKYPHFKSNAVNIPTNVVTEVFMLDGDMEFGTVQLRISNNQPSVDESTPNPGNFARSLRIWCTKLTNIAAIAANTSDLIEPKAMVAPNGTYSLFGFTMGPDERLFVLMGGSGGVARASALQHEVASVI